MQTALRNPSGWYAIRIFHVKQFIVGAPAYMDTFHRKAQKNDSRTARECQFCQRMDPQFAGRRDIDRLVLPELKDTPAAHITEDGYVLHRMAEMRVRFGFGGTNPSRNVA